MSRLLFLLLPLLGLAGCAGKSSPPPDGSSQAALEPVERTDEYGHTERFRRRIADGVREGTYRRFNTNGVLVEQALYRNDTLHGARILFFDTGDTLSVEHYDMGRFEGEFRQYYENGRLQLQGHYIDNQMSGSWRQYYETGELMEVVTFAANQENGPFVEYFRNGNVKAEGQYLDGDNEHGLLKLYNEKGVLVRKMNCDKGLCRTIWQAKEESELEN